jgi:hypothetical protein
LSVRERRIDRGADRSGQDQSGVEYRASQPHGRTAAQIARARLFSNPDKASTPERHIRVRALQIAA